MEDSHAAMTELLTGGVVMLGASLLFVMLFRRVGLGAVLGYLAAGILVGPEVLGYIKSPEVILQFAEIGIILLLFLVGLELAPARLWRLRSAIFGMGLLQVTLCGIALFLLIYWGTNFTLGAAIVLGLPLALSSTAQILPMLQSKGRMNSPQGEKAFSILLFQDLSIIPLLTIVAALSRAPADPSAPPGWLLAIYSVLAVLGLVIAGRYVLSPLFKLIGRVAEREMFIVAALFTVFGSAALMNSLGLSAALGAFVAGVMLADSPYRHEIEADVDPFRSILLGMFFLAVGMMLDFDVILANPAFIVVMAMLLVLTKVFIICGLGMAFKMTFKNAFVLGLLLSQGGEFGFVLFTEAERALLIEPEASSMFGAIVTISMATTPFLMMLAGKFGGVRGAKRDDLDGPELAERANAIVVGHGRFGQTVSQMLLGANISVTLIDSNPAQIDTSGTFGRKVFYGDGTRVDLLRRAGAEQCCAILFCMDDKDFDHEQLQPIKTTFPDAQILVRAYDRRQLLELYDSGIAGVTREVYESAIVMARKALAAIETDAVVIEQADAEYRALDRDRLLAQRETGDMLAGASNSFGGLNVPAVADKGDG